MQRKILSKHESRCLTKFLKHKIGKRKQTKIIADKLPEDISKLMGKQLLDQTEILHM